MVPFGLIQIDNSNWAKEKSKYKELKLGSANDEDFKVDAPLYLIGTSSEGTYIVKKGMIINSNRNYSNRYGSLFQSSFDRVSNLWGSPVINNRGEVWGVHVISSDTTSYELKVDYIKNILKQIKANGKISRGDIGVHLDLIILGIAKTNYKLSNQNAEEILANIKNSGGPPEIMIISTITPGSPSEKILKAGDIIYKVNNNIIGNDFLKFDNILNENVGNEITVTVSRNGEIITLNIKVNNTQDDKISKYISFAGAYFHDISDSVKSYLFTNIEGVYLTYTSVGSPFSKISAKNSGSKNNYILTSINSKQIKSIDSLVDYFKSNCELESIYVEGVDYNAFSNKMTSQSVDLDFNSLLQVYTLNPENLKWEVDSLDLNKYCSETKPGSIKRNKSGHKMVRLSSNINDEGK
jgi:S1-C subfamily serine protease